MEIFHIVLGAGMFVIGFCLGSAFELHREVKRLDKEADRKMRARALFKRPSE
jgi:hypothetical protein